MGLFGSKNSPAKQREAETYYNNVSKNDVLSDSNSSHQPVQMHLDIKNAESGLDYSIQILISDQPNKMIELGNTTTNQCDEENSINFEMLYILNYYFEKQQNILFKINKAGNIIDINTTLGNIMGSRGQVLIKEFEDSEKLIISATPMENSNLMVTINIGAEFDKKNFEMFYVIKKEKKHSKVLMRKNTETGSSHLSIYKSEVVKFDYSNQKRNFTQIKLPANVLCDGDLSNNIIIEFYDYINTKVVTTYNTSVNKLSAEKSPIVLDAFTRHKHILKLDVKCSFVKEYTFLDYLRGGLQIGLSIGIDFTGSNGHPKDEVSLHNISRPGGNYYEKAIRSCGDIVAYYDYDNVFPVFGYGAVLPGQSGTNHCFNLNFSNSPDILSIDGVLQTYRGVLEKLNFSGPTYFSPLIWNIIRMIKQGASNTNNMNTNSYHILLILTDGIINDMDNTIDALVEGSFLPLSVIIVGIGKNDFSNMNVLDADDEPLYDKNGRKAARDLVQFVPFYQFENDGRKLAEEVLEEVPGQVVEYYSKIKRSPPGDPKLNMG